ncbi:hypothetical protein [Shewanella surugensis]|uniref:Alpha/beta hydrolase n=1 Tax=Shewanella surugensis TaxID=212020 RepID=A0ABT0LJM6_9GAMM|nr:hypothetical protein [Shewanella surugensis]MCL1127570.1 hypothetical protein [Shewanella surugensis]
MSAASFKADAPSSLAYYQDNVNQYKISSRGGEMNILIIEANSPSKAETIIFFNGLSQVMPDWSPVLIEKLVGAYNLLFMDYPGIGGTVAVKGNDFNFINIPIISMIYKIHCLTLMRMSQGGYSFSCVVFGNLSRLKIDSAIE